MRTPGCHARRTGPSGPARKLLWPQRPRSRSSRGASPRAKRQEPASWGFVNLGFLNLGFLNLGFLNLGFLNLGFLNLGFLNLGFLNLGFLNLVPLIAAEREQARRRRRNPL